MISCLCCVEVFSFVVFLCKRVFPVIVFVFYANYVGFDSAVFD